jgi:peptide/nickel transport system substrate-binding protein
MNFGLVKAAAALALACIIAACAPANQSRDTARPNVLRLALGADPPGLNPLVQDNANVTYLAPLIHGFLLRTDGAGRLIPDLATEVPTLQNHGISPDGRTITYHLQRRARWHDDVRFDARDVIFSYRAAMNPANAVPDRTGYDRVTAIRALDPYTVRVTLAQPFTPFLASFLTLGANDPYPLLPAHLLARERDLNRDAYAAAPVGLGPYKLARWERGQRLLLTADPNYFRGAPHIARIDFTFVPNVNSVAALWKTGQIDLTVARVQAGRQFLDAVRSVPGTHAVLEPHYEFDYLLFNTSHAPLDDVRVRRALIEAIDRGRIMRELDGDLYVPAETDRLPGQFAYDPTIGQPRYDPAASARRLDAAGWRLTNGVRTKAGRPLELDLVGTTESPSTGRFNLFVQQDLAKLGIRTSIKSYNYNLIWASAAEGGINKAGRFDLEYSGWQPNSVADHSYLFRCDQRPPEGDNLARICDPAIEAAAKIELSAADPAREAAADRAMARRLIAQSYVLFLGFDREAVAYRDGLEGIEPSVTGMHLWNAWQWRWRSQP